MSLPQGVPFPYETLKNPFAPSEGIGVSVGGSPSSDNTRVQRFLLTWTRFLKRPFSPHAPHITLQTFIKSTTFQTTLVGQVLYFSILLNSTTALALHWDLIATTFKREYPHYDLVFNKVESNTSMILLTVHEQPKQRNYLTWMGGLFVLFLLASVLLMVAAIVLERYGTHLLPTPIARWWVDHQPSWLGP